MRKIQQILRQAAALVDRLTPPSKKVVPKKKKRCEIKEGTTVTGVDMDGKRRRHKIKWRKTELACER